MKRRTRIILFLLAVPILIALIYRPAAEEYWVHEFEHTQLSDEFLCEGATFGDVSGDGQMDYVSGAYWYEGPDFSARHAYYEPEPFSIETYSKCFLVFTEDFNQDNLEDIFVVGFPGEVSTWYKNPGKTAGHWEAFEITDEVSNESPAFIDITGDGQPELIHIKNGRYGYSEPDWQNPEAPWPFTPISEDRGLTRFTHGLGVGDVNGDGRMDLLEAKGWYEQPASLAGNPVWRHHSYEFAEVGGSQMYAYDVDGDGDNDIISSEYAHGWGLLWFEHVKDADGITFKKHRIMGETPEENPYSVAFSGLHAIDLVDMDGDGVKDIITGKRYWAHMGRDPGELMPTVIYWFKIDQQEDGSVDFKPYFIGDETGVGTQVVVKDYNDDGLPDLVIGNKKGAAYYVHTKRAVSKEEWEAAQPELAVH